MSVNYRYPAFDTLELNTEGEFTYSRYEKLNPVRAGELVAGLNASHNRGRWHRFFDENSFDFGAESFTYTRKPLLLYFYEQDWNRVSLTHLKQLDGLRSDLQSMQANLLVVTTYSAEALQQLCWKENLSLDIFHDSQLELASLLKIYSEHSPTWSCYAGLERNVPLPALYVLDRHRQVALDFANENILEQLPVEQIKAALSTEHLYWPHKRTA